VKKLAKGERHTTLVGFSANYTQEEIGDRCGVSASAICQSIEKIRRGDKPPIILHVNREGEVTDAYEAEYRQVFKFRVKKV